MDEVPKTAEAFNDAQKEFEAAEKHFIINKKVWQQNKEFSEVRTARWDRNEKRKTMTKLDTILIILFTVNNCFLDVKKLKQLLGRKL